MPGRINERTYASSTCG
ncbi:hypothetical protein BLA29_008478 [Euroglyphus maynei]|uniref:Uncharacterized protein n=1 Tax=Euroglyphus maynei TaxID=6958 RepID=A0A1Y3BI60_EURMA|nr:hypothetical protein BLA29_008478 [Euroglyphus maynei]